MAPCWASRDRHCMAVQCEGPKLNYKKSLEEGALVFRQTEEEAGESTDKRDIALLYSLCS